MIRFLLTLLVLVTSVSALPQSYLELPMRDEGRIKPFESFAQGKLLQLSGKSAVYHFPNDKRTKLMSAADWMTELFFQPHESKKHKVFLINDPQIAVTIGLEPRSHRMYSFEEIDAKRFLLQEQTKAINEIPDADRSEFQKTLLSVNNNVKLYEALSQSMEFTAPVSAFKIVSPALKKLLILPQERETFSFLEIYRKAALLSNVMDSLLFKPKDQWSALDSGAYKISRELFEWSQINQQSIPEIFPFEHDGEWHWLSPWAVMNNQLLHMAGLNSAMTYLDEFRSAYLEKNEVKMSEKADSLFTVLTAKAGDKAYRTGALKAESRYNHARPFISSQFLFGLGLLLALLGLLWKPRLLQNVSTLLLWIGFLYSGYGIALRMYINLRPPVTTLFETFIFTAWTCALLGLVVRHLKRPDIGNLLGHFSALVLLLISNKYAAEGDTLKVLVAVLDSNFWLATHVVTITLGYAGVCAAGVVGHIWIIKRLWTKASKEDLDDVYKSMMGILAFGLILSFIGTVLGGIWADQSWGRFWGWDPKENGALLIVLWCTTLYHARLAGWLKKGGMAIGSTLGIIIVMLAWFGINLLGVGLHSYGFTSGIATALILYCVLQTAFALFAWLLLHRKGEKCF